MARIGKKTLNIGPSKIGSRSQRLKIPQPITRPIHISQHRFINQWELRNNPWWWITHKRGITRERVGGDPREARAIPKSLVKGSLPERIVFKWLVVHNFVSGIDFDFQSSMEGGRIEMGGLVVDFLFRHQMIIIQVQGPTHNQLLRQQKDNEQTMILATYGYQVLELDDDIIYNEALFDTTMRMIFNLVANRGGATSDFQIYGLQEHNHDPMLLDVMLDQAVRIKLLLLDVERSIT
jgi:very-short-patch-repair endonuclease